jgi:hypothetical protein
MKSWPPVIVRPGRRPKMSHSPFNKPPRSREVRFDKVVTELLGLSGPINLTCVQYKSNLIHQGQNNVVLNRHRQELPPWNFKIATALSPPFPSKWSTFPYLPHLVTPTNMNIRLASTHHNHHILLVHEKEVLHVSETYHSSSTDVYQLNIAHLVDNINTSTTRMTYERVLPYNLSPSYKTRHLVHNQHIQR